MKTRHNLLLLAVFSVVMLNSFTATESTDQKVEKLLSQLTLQEKISLIHGNTYFTTPAIPRLGIPALHLSDGPCGVREENAPDRWGSANWTNDATAYFPSLTSLASTWNTELATEFGNAYGEEAVVRGKDIMLAPGLNINRTPLNGRNWEYMSEDPYLTSRIAVNYIKAVQSKGIAVCAKHYALNNQEFERGTINVEASERALREIYLPAFEASVKEGEVLSVMGAYNKFRGRFACQNPYLLQDILKGEWGFRGLVMSDWGAVHNTLEAANSGLDLEMYPIDGKKDYYMGQALLEEIKAGTVDEKAIDDKVRRILYVMLKLNIMGKAEPDTTGMASLLGTPDRAKTALKIAEESVILLKNKQALPLNLKNIKTLAVIGDNATRKHARGGGSTIIKAKYEITPLEGLQSRLGNSVKINFVQGYNASKNFKSVDKSLIAEAVKTAALADAVLIFGGLNHQPGLDCEGDDKPDMKLPFGQDELIKAVIKANPNTIVIMIAGSQVEMGSWISDVKGLLYTSYLGMETGTALAEVLFGDVNPSGKLSYTLPFKLEDSPSFVLGEYPGKDGVVNYKDDIWVGYRYFDTKNVKPLFPFGFGLSYTTFAYTNCKVDLIQKTDPLSCVVSFEIKNTGNLEGKEIAQVYVRDLESALPRPTKELKGFAKASLKAGESKTLKVTLDKRAFQYYDPAKKQWVLEPGKFEILIGSSSDNILLKEQIEL
ncbi:MAG: glycoside hydrolase family 3 C-terminal domain-containing protein [Bacteroidota bacterium]